MKEFKSALGIRGDALYCPLPIYIDLYWTCRPNCWHCYSRRLNRTWGNDFRIADPDKVIRQLKSNKGTSPLKIALKQKKTIRLGNRTDPFQPCEKRHKVSTKLLNFLMEQDWSVVVQTKFVSNMWELVEGHLTDCVIMGCIITVGLESDWEVFERKRTEPVFSRLETLKQIQNKGNQVGIIGEPFIPGYHTVKQFEETLKVLKSYGINRFNTYNFHFNDYVAKNLHHIGIDIEKIWYYNQDQPWRKILKQLLELGEKYNMILGCPDFVNSGKTYKEKANTCCGIDVHNPCTWNTHYFKRAVQEGKDPLECWDGVGEKEEGERIINGKAKGMYTLKDAGL